MGGAPFSTGSLWHTSGSGLFSNDDVVTYARWDNHGSSYILVRWELNLAVIVVSSNQVLIENIPAYNSW